MAAEESAETSASSHLAEVKYMISCVITPCILVVVDLLARTHLMRPSRDIISLWWALLCIPVSPPVSPTERARSSIHTSAVSGRWIPSTAQLDVFSPFLRIDSSTVERVADFGSSSMVNP